MASNEPRYLRWEIPEFQKIERSRRWHLSASAIALIMLFFCFFSFESWKLVFLGLNSNFLFALIIILAAMIMILKDSQSPKMLKFELGPEGVQVGSIFYDYDEFKNFAVLYKPKRSLKQLYLEFKGNLKPRLSIPLRRQDALTVRNFLVKYLDEDLERLEPPLSEQLTKALKL